MTTNEKCVKITKRIFKGNNGKQFQLLRQKIEVIEFNLSGQVPSISQQEYIDGVNSEYAKHENEIHKELNSVALNDITE